MGQYDYERILTAYLENIRNQLFARPLFLGGVTASGGGSGGPPGGFVGYLPQTRVTFDLSEDSVQTIPASGASLLDNLNRIRYRLTDVETSIDNIISSGTGPGISGVIVKDDGVTVAGGITVLNFANATVTIDSASGVTISSYGGGGDMLKSVYDSDNDGIIDPENLGTGTPSQFTYLRGNGQWVALSGLMYFSDGYGDPVDVNSDAAQDGTSPYAARSDHKHHLGTHGHDGADITTGQVNVARLGTGSPSITTYLRGDGTWGTLSVSGVTFNDSEGDPVDVSYTARSDGTSAFGARRDHRHLLGQHTHGGGAIISGYVNPEYLGTGTAITSKYLRGDGTWQVVPSGDMYKSVYDTNNDGIVNNTHNSQATAGIRDLGGNIVYFMVDDTIQDDDILSYSNAATPRLNPVGQFWIRIGNGTTHYQMLNVIQVNSDLRNIIRKGSRIRVVYNNQTLYFYVAKIVYDPAIPRTQIFTIPSKTYTLPAYVTVGVSGLAVCRTEPVHGSEFPDWFEYNCSWTGTSSNPVGGITYARFRCDENIAHVQLRVVCTGVTNFGAGNYNFTIPVSGDFNANTWINYGQAVVRRTGTGNWPFYVQVNPTDTVLQFFVPTWSGGVNINNIGPSFPGTWDTNYVMYADFEYSF